MKQKNNIITILLLIIFLIPGVLGLLHRGFPTTDDGGWMIIRFASFYEVIRHGQIPARFLFSLNHGYGYPVADFLYPLFMYIGVPIHVVGFGFINTIKIVLGGSFILSAIFSFFWLRKLMRNIPAFVGALVYAFFPYHLFDIYQRGSVGEVIALAIVPFILWQIEKKFFLFVVIGIALLILAHNTLALLFLPILIAYILIRKVFSIKYLVSSILLSLGLAAFFWIPALYDSQFTIFRTIQISDFAQYFLSTNNFGLLGIFALMVSIICVTFVFKKSQKHDIFFLFITYLGLFLALPISTFVWKIIPLPQLVQFPFRFLSIVILGVSFLTAYMIDTMKTELKAVIAVLCIGLLYFSSWKYLFPNTYQLYPDEYYATNQDTTTVKNEYMPKWVKQIPTNAPASSIEVVKGKASLADITTNNANTIAFTTHVSDPSIVQINKIYFPGWNIFVNNKQQTFSYNNPHGVMQVRLPNGDYTIKATFGETTFRLLSDAISIVSVIILIVCSIYFKRKQLSVTKKIYEKA